MSRRIAILGFGLTGKLLSYMLLRRGYEVSVFTKTTSGMSFQNNLGPLILHKTDATSRLISELYDGRVDDEYKTFGVGYLVQRHDEVQIVDDVLQAELLAYNQKTRGLNCKVESSVMSQGKNKIVGWDARQIRLEEKLRTGCEGRIDLTLCDVGINGKLSKIKQRYEEVYSTIPLAVLADMNLEPDDIKFGLAPTTFVKMRLPFDTGHDYVYDVTDNIFKRYVKLNFRGEYMAEIPNAAIKFDNNTVIWHNLIKESIDESEMFGCRLEGRFARHNHGERMDTLIERYWNE